jgi:hypothetical protein
LDWKVEIAGNIGTESLRFIKSPECRKRTLRTDDNKIYRSENKLLQLASQFEGKHDEFLFEGYFATIMHLKAIEVLSGLKISILNQLQKPGG